MSVTRTILQTVPIPSLPGWESRFVLLQYPPGVASPAHTHPQLGVNYVISGSVSSRWEGAEGKGTEGETETETFRAGETFIDLADRVHHVWNPSETEELKIVVGYVIKVGEPNVVML